MTKEYSLEELLNSIDVDNTNFLAFPITPWGAIGVKAFANYLHDKGIDISGGVSILKHPESGYAISPHEFDGFSRLTVSNLSSLELPISKTEKGKNIISGIVRNKEVAEEFYVLFQGYIQIHVWAYLQRIIKNKRVVIIIFDEGICMYCRSLSQEVREAKMLSDSMFQFVAGLYYRLVRMPLINKALFRKGLVHYFTLLDIKNHEKNTNIIKYYNREIIEKSKDNTISTEIYRDSVVICTQPLCGQGCFLKNEDVDLYKRICQYCNSKGIGVILKPHPREDSIERYSNIENLYIENRNDLAMETVLSSSENKPRVIIGLNSSILITAKLLFDVKTVSVINLFDDDALSSAKYFSNKELDVFLKEYAIMPSSLDVLFDEICSISE